MEMASFYDEIEIEDFEYDPEEETYYYPCPCGDRFQITKEELRAGEETATCPSCSLIVKVIYDKFCEVENIEYCILVSRRIFRKAPRRPPQKKQKKKKKN